MRSHVRSRVKAFYLRSQEKRMISSEISEKRLISDEISDKIVVRSHFSL